MFAAAKFTREVVKFLQKVRLYILKIDHLSRRLNAPVSSAQLFIYTSALRVFLAFVLKLFLYYFHFHFKIHACVDIIFDYIRYFHKISSAYESQ